MPLDVEVEQLLAAMAAAPMPALGSVPPAEIRVAQLALARQMPQVTAVKRVEDLVIAGPAAPIPARLYCETDRPRALLLFYHGGGWTFGGLDVSDGVLRRLAKESGLAVLSVDYRLAPEHVFPAAVDDALAAARWAAVHCRTLVGWAAPLLVGGESAGANLAAVVSQLARTTGPDIAAQLLSCPCVASYSDSPYMRTAYSPFPPEGAIGWFFDQYIPDHGARTDPRFAPIEAKDLSGLPPAFVATAEYDALREQGEQYADRLAEAGVECEVKCYDGTIHGFLEFDGGLRQPSALIRDFSRFLDRTLSKAASDGAA